MIHANSPRRTNVRLLSLLTGVALTGLTAIAQAGGPPPGGKPAMSEPNDKAEDAQAPKAQSTSTPTDETSAPAEVPQFPFPSARVAAVDGAVTLKLINKTNAVINYQVVAGTQQRDLAGQSEVELQGLPMPMTLTYQREDSGLLRVVPRSTEPGVLEVQFEATTDFDVDTKALEINENGSVFLN
ncbi:MAG: hypothetical protein HC825_03245 [Oscillatoriales cyanobacterium RM1_1_9]|nr:hypothetical protein [Oscillatoriales cyanobacterium SM2_3_0]NJO45644.1 hypothetical protein [Oscillatoriales cyanobacterium RM2_1_1]NJO70975.1 hypothetical protein [Oscillatoriales cyanobacterium RM1_1_9]